MIEDLLDNSLLLFSLTFALLLAISWGVWRIPSRPSTKGEEVPGLPQLDEHEIDGLRFQLTCSASPEQYDVYLEDEQVGYVRYRFGNLSADYPDVGMEGLLIEELTEETGILTDQERAHWLPVIANKINDRLKKA